MNLRRQDLPRTVKVARMIPANAGLHRAYADKLTGLVRETVLAQNGRIRWMEQTKAWKLYQKIKPEGRR